MGYKLINESILSSIASAIRDCGYSGTITPLAFPTAINSILNTKDLINGYVKNSNYIDLDYIPTDRIGPFGLNFIFKMRGGKHINVTGAVSGNSDFEYPVIDELHPYGGCAYKVLSTDEYGDETYFYSYINYRSAIVSNMTELNPDSFNLIEKWQYIDEYGPTTEYNISPQVFEIYPYTLPNLTKITDRVSFLSDDRITGLPYGLCPYNSSISIPNCSYIGSSAFAYTNLTNECVQDILDTYKSYSTVIQQGTFMGCYNISSLDLTGYTSIYSKAFFDCTILSSVDMPNCSYIGDAAFQNCYLTTISPMPNCSYIGDRAFQNCSNLVSISLPNCSYIGSNAFYNCNNLSSISLPNCSHIMDGAFNGCTNLSYISIPNCSYIGVQAFMRCINLSSISIPNCTYIASYAFNSCFNLSYISMPNVEYIGNYVFQNCSKLESIDIPNCSYIGDRAFYSCSSLSYVSIPNVEYIGNSAFYSCRILSSIDMPNCSYIGNSIFGNCTNLSSISIPNCSYIGSYAFTYCNNLSYISIPNCSYIGGSAFYFCSKLESIYILSTKVPALNNSNAFNSTPISRSTYLGYFGSIYVLSTLVNSFKTATNWKVYSSRIK